MSSQLEDCGFKSQSELHASRSNRQPVASAPFYTMFEWRNPRVSTDDVSITKKKKKKDVWVWDPVITKESQKLCGGGDCHPEA